MKKGFFILIFILSVFVLDAHPASNVKLDFDMETHQLSVDFTHKVSDADNHFIYEITVYLNKEEVISQKISKQDTNMGGRLVYKIIDAKIGDKITVKTNCNKSGKKSGELVIE